MSLSAQDQDIENLYKALSLSTVVDQIESKHYSKGFEYVNTFRLKSKDGKELCHLPVTRGEQKDALDALISIATPAPFGRAQKTILDDSVRKALQVLPDQVEMDWEPTTSMLTDIKFDLVPDAENVEARFDKINIYTEDGHFVSHKDTPRSETQFGTLVVQLPTWFEGGELTLSHDNKTTKVLEAEALQDEFDDSLYRAETPETKEKRLDATKPSKFLRWVAYFGDVTHQVNRISAGCRITLTYVLHRTGIVLEPSAVLLNRGENVRKAFLNLVKDAHFAPDGCVLGFDSLHLYEEEQLKASEKKLAEDDAKTVSVAKTAKALKNQDAVLVVAARAAGLQVEVFRILTEENTEENWFSSGEPKNEWLLEAMPKDDRGFGKIRQIFDAGYDKGITADELEEYCDQRLEDLDDDLIMVRHDGRAEKALTDYIWWSAEGAFGNEATEVSYYVRSVIAIRFPPASERENTIDIPLTVDRLLNSTNTTTSHNKAF